MKYELVIDKTNHSFIYEVTDDLSIERLLWSDNENISSDWFNVWLKYKTSLELFCKSKWISKEEAFAYML